MNYCQFRNLTIKRMANAGDGIVLPDDYQRVEYLQSSGDQYMVTGIYNTTPLDFYCKYEALAINSNNYIFGCWDNVGRCFVSYNSTGYQYLGYRETVPGGGTMVINTVCELSGSLKPGTQTLYKDGVLQVSGTNSAAITTPKELTLFAVNYGSIATPPIQAYITGRIYRFALYSNNAKILDSIPCYRISDNKPGMYDIISNVFRYNQNQGNDFIVGQDVL